MGKIALFPALLTKAFIAAGGLTLSSVLRKRGFSCGLAWAIAFSLRFFISESAVSAMPSTSSGEDGSGEEGSWEEGSSSKRASNSIISYKADSSGDGLNDANPAAPAPENNILSPFGELDPDPELEVYARIRLLESRLIEDLPPQVESGEYEDLVRHNFKTAYNLGVYQMLLETELYEIKILEIKGDLVELLGSLLLSEPEGRLLRILRDSIFRENKLKEEALSFVQDKLLSWDLGDPRDRPTRIILEYTVTYWRNDLRNRGSDSDFYKGFLAHLRGEG